MESWLTREQAAKFLGVTVQSVKNYEKQGLLKSETAILKDVRGREQATAVYDPRAVALVRQLKNKGPLIQVSSDEESTRDWLTRAQAMDLLRVSAQTLKNYERAGKLHAKRARREDAKGHDQLVVVYDPKDIEKLPRGMLRLSVERTAGELEAYCYEFFEQGKSIREIVMAARVTSETVRGLYETWLDAGGSKVVVSIEAKRLLENMLGPFESVADLVDRVTERLGGSAAT